jgi:hypothetical protein
MTAEELERVQSHEVAYRREVGSEVGCFVAAGSALAFGIALMFLFVGWVGSWFGSRDPVKPAIIMGLALFGVTVVGVAWLLVKSYIVKPIKVSRMRRRADYDLVDELHLWDPELFISYDPVGKEVSGKSSHGDFKFTIFDHEYLIVIAPDRLFHFTDYYRGDLDIYHQLEPKDGDDSYGWFPSECRLVYRVMDRHLMEFQSLGPLSRAVGEYHAGSRPPALAAWRKDPKRRFPFVLVGAIDRPSEVRVFEGELAEALPATL